MAYRILSFLAVITATAAGCRKPAPNLTGSSSPSPASLEAPGLHNVFRLSATLYSGSSPDNDLGFRSLRRLGVRTVVSVDGARPDLLRAARFGLRYVHLPIGYDGVPRSQALRLVRAVRDLPGPVYLHCHHGKHRGPAAAAVALLCLDRRWSTVDAAAWLRLAGTDPRYTGLYAAPNRLRRPVTEELDAVPADFPESAPVTDLVRLMVDIDHRWHHLEAVRKAGWKIPPDHPDIDPPHEALQLAELYRESARLPAVQEKPREFRQWLADAAAVATELEGVLRRPGAEVVDPGRAETLFRRAQKACMGCHTHYRDVPEDP